MSQSDDIDLIRAELQYWHRFALGHRYGMIGQRAQSTQDALDALARVERPDLFQWRARAICTGVQKRESGNVPV